MLLIDLPYEFVTDLVNSKFGRYACHRTPHKTLSGLVVPGVQIVSSNEVRQLQLTPFSFQCRFFSIIIAQCQWATCGRQGEQKKLGATSDIAPARLGIVKPVISPNRKNGSVGVGALFDQTGLESLLQRFRVALSQQPARGKKSTDANEIA